MATIKELLLTIDGIKNIRLEKEITYQFNTKELNNAQYIENFLNNIKSQVNHKKYNYLYIFSLQDDIPVDKAYSAYRSAKESKKSERAYARLNTKSSCLYVGSSKGLILRIKQHLGFGPKGTYAMHLCHWCENLHLEITLKIYGFDKGIGSKTFQAFEDGVWNSLRPMLGRQGKR